MPQTTQACWKGREPLLVARQQQHALVGLRGRWQAVKQLVQRPALQPSHRAAAATEMWQKHLRLKKGDANGHPHPSRRR